MGPNRILPQLPAQAFKTYQIVAPVSTHFRDATCAEVDCAAYLSGWRTVVDERVDLGQGQAHYIRTESGRRFVEHRDEAGMTVFEFPAGQKCFRPHKARLDRPEIYVVTGGDWRGNPRGLEPRRHANADDWIDDFATHQQTLADRLNQG